MEVTRLQPAAPVNAWTRLAIRWRWNTCSTARLRRSSNSNYPPEEKNNKAVRADIQYYWASYANMVTEYMSNIWNLSRLYPISKKSNPTIWDTYHEISNFNTNNKVLSIVLYKRLKPIVYKLRRRLTYTTFSSMFKPPPTARTESASVPLCLPHQKLYQDRKELIRVVLYQTSFQAG